MDEIKLNRLLLRDFQGGQFNLPANGLEVFIFGANAVGKTRLVSAFSWLLFNKDALGRSDFEIKNLDAQGEASHGLEHSVEAELFINGEIIILSKTYKEKWTKKRGNAQREFSGHTTEFSIDGVPIQEKDYNARISEIAGDESRFRLLTSPTAFPQLHWQKQRQLLLEICGDITDQDVIDSNPKLAPLSSILGKHTLEDHRKVVTARRTEINKEMERLPVRIDENRRGLPDVAGINRDIAEKEVKHFENAVNDAKLRLQGVNTGGNIAGLSTKIVGLNVDLRKVEDFHRSGSLSTLNRLNQQISELSEKVNASRRRMTAIDGDLKRKEGQVQSMDADLSRLRNQWTATDGESFRDMVGTICPACGQDLPSNRVDEARDKALASFNQSRAERLGDIDRKGHSLKDQREQTGKEIETLKEERTRLETFLPDLQSELATAQQDRDTLKQSSEDFTQVPHWSELSDEIEAVEIEIKAEREGKAGDAEKIKAEIQILQESLFVAKGKIDLFARREQGEKRILILKDEEKSLSREFEKLEEELYLIDFFVKTKCGLLNEKINSKFKTVRWRLFESLINGGIQEVCELTINGIGYSSGLNNAARIQGGLEIIGVLQEFYGIRCPIFIDNRESVTEIPPLNCQVISLIVSPEDKQLRIESKRNRMKEAA